MQPHVQQRGALENARSMLRKLTAGAMTSARTDNERERIETLNFELDTLMSAYMDPKIGDVQANPYSLTRSERRLVDLLASRPGKVFPQSSVVSALYFDVPGGDAPQPKIVDVYVCKIRKKITGAPFVIETVWGEGYRLTMKDPYPVN